MFSIEQSIKDQFVAVANHISYPLFPENLYTPIQYINTLGGKRLRPLLLLLANDLFGGKIEQAMPAALAVEWFHNFTLMHDDIMDNAPMRRGNATVHVKWDTNTAILSGDVMLVKAYQFLQELHPTVLPQVFTLFNQTAVEVCEGQQLDMNFEHRNEVDVEEYLQMIRLKTSVLLAASLKMGAIIAGANSKDADLLYQVGENVGVAFQLQDDLLDVYGNPSQFGKQVGGDILANKKTFLLLQAQRRASLEQQKQIDYWLQKTSFEPLEKINAMVGLYEQLNIRAIVLEQINYYTNSALEALTAIDLPKSHKLRLEQLLFQLLVREH